MIGDSDIDSARLKAALGRAGEVLFFLAVLALAILSFTTSFGGFRTLMTTLQASLAAFGLQASMIAVSILLARSYRFRQKLLFLAACVLTAGTSIFFSYIGVRAVLVGQVAAVRAPLLERQHLLDEQARLQQAATILRGRALARLEADKTAAFASVDVAGADRDVRVLEARKYQSELRAIRADQNLAATDALLTDEERFARLAGLQVKEARVDHLLEVARAAGEKLELDAAESRISGQDVQTVRDQLIAYQPDFDIAQDWTALGTSYARLGAVWGLMPPDFQSTNPMPEPPVLALLDHGRPTNGHDHPVIEAAWSIANLRDPADIFSLTLAVLFDAIPLISIFATAAGYRRFPDRLADVRRWMAATTVQLQMMPGILPWLVQSLRDLLWTSPVRADDPRIAALQQRVERLKEEMDEFLAGLPTPPGTLDTISAQLASLFARANVVSFRSSETLKNLAMRAYVILSDAIDNSALSDAHKEMARTFVAKQGERFATAVNDAFAD